MKKPRTNITRKDFLKGAVGMAALATAGGALSGCAPSGDAQTDASYVPGIYEGRAEGYMGEAVVHVEVDETIIVNVVLSENFETHTKVPSNAAANILCPKIVEKQSLAIDTVSGATFTSFGIINAATAALEKAGADVGKLKKPLAVELVEGENESYDFLVIGSGVSGLIAALSAATEDLTRKATGYSVLVIERNGFAGGSSLLSDGGYALCSGTVPNEMYDTSFTGDGLTDLLESFCGETLNRELIKNMVDISGSTANGIFNLGSPFAIAKTEQRLKLDNGEGYVSIRAKQYSDPRYDGAFGARITDNLVENLKEMGVEIRICCAAEELIVENGVVTGVKVQEGDKAYDIMAKKIILAAGGYAQNEEMVQKYAPDYVGTKPFCGGGSQGIGIQMAIDAVDATVVGHGLNAYPGIDYRYGMGGQLSGLMTEGVYINREGNRFYDGRDIDLRCIGMNICRQTDQMAFSILDENSGFVQATGLMDMAIEKGWGYSAESLEDLANQIGVSFETMMTSIESMREAVKEGKDVEHNVPEKYMNSVQGPPFYAIEVRSVAIGSLAGLNVSPHCEVLNSKGEIVPNLYAAGETMIGNIFRKYYPLGSFSIGSCINTGRLAGERARATLKVLDK